MAEAEALIRLPLESLLASASGLREAVFADKIELCAIINIRSGNCAMNCAFCAQSRHNRGNAAEYGLLPDDELQMRIRELSRLPLAHIGLVASGAALSGAEFERLCALVASLPETVRPRICASLGRVTAEQMAMLRQAGLVRYHHNLETSEAYYPHVCQTQTWRSRLATARRALDAGLELCCGGLFGMGESWEDRVALALVLRDEGIENVPLNFLHPAPGSPLEKLEPPRPGDALRIIAIFRHVLPGATLRICGGRLKSLASCQDRIFEAGANALMTGDFLTTKGQGTAEDLILLKRLGLSPLL